MKVFVTGAGGQLGYDVINELARRGHVVIGSDILHECSEKLFYQYMTLDITDRVAVEKSINVISPDVIIHCAAWTAVDAAEEEQNKELVYKINVLGTLNIAECCKKCNCKIMYISTDYVFDGSGNKPWDPDSSSFEPLNVYGKSKLAGERIISDLMSKYFIIRISWLFGKNGNNFVKTMLRIGKNNKKLKIVCDQIGTPTYSYDLARLMADMITTDKYGYYHVTNEGGYISWYDFAYEIFKIANYNVELFPVSTKEYGICLANRPMNSRLEKRKIIESGFMPLPDWQDALKRYLKDLGF